MQFSIQSKSSVSLRSSTFSFRKVLTLSLVLVCRQLLQFAQTSLCLKFSCWGQNRTRTRTRELDAPSLWWDYSYLFIGSLPLKISQWYKEYKILVAIIKKAVIFVKCAMKKWQFCVTFKRRGQFCSPKRLPLLSFFPALNLPIWSIRSSLVFWSFFFSSF